jgi:hypothetical protein
MHPLGLLLKIGDLSAGDVFVKVATSTLRAGTRNSSARSAGGVCRSCRKIEKMRFGLRFESKFPIGEQDAKMFLLKFLQNSLQIKNYSLLVP